MADVFISYAKKDRPYAEELAKFLDELGLTTWWDPNLVGGHEFRERITDEIDLSKATIVIWSPNSVKSAFVIDEADHARQSAKLISGTVPGFNPDKIPIGFRGSQAISIGEGDQVIQALIVAGVGDIKRTGGYLLGIFANQIKAIERNARRTQRLAFAAFSVVLLGVATFAASQWLLRPSVYADGSIQIQRARYSDKLHVSSSISFGFQTTSEIARLFAPSYDVRDYTVVLYDKTFRRLASESEAKNMRLSYGGGAIVPSFSSDFTVPMEPRAEYFVVACVSLSKGSDAAVSIKIGIANLYREYDKFSASILGLLDRLDIAENQIETLQRDSGCKLSNSNFVFR